MDKRKDYSKPTISRVELRPEEAVLGNCKSFADPSPSSCFDGDGNGINSTGS